MGILRSGGIIQENSSTPVPDRLNGLLIRYGNIGRGKYSDNSLKTMEEYQNGRYPAIAADGDKHEITLICDGTETNINITTYGSTDCGSFKIKINDVYNTATIYEDYLAVGAFINRTIAIVEPLKNGGNIITLELNGKNAASTDYAINLKGLSVE